MEQLRRSTNGWAPASVRDWVRLLRPHQWTKNVFVFVPVLFSSRLMDSRAVTAASLACLSFCLLSSAIYVFNDLLDAKADRSHPRKKNRPIASGRISPALASLSIVGLLALSAVVAVGLSRTYWFFAAGYLLNSVLYCLVLKHKVIVDVMGIAVGFVLRLLAGCAAIAVVPTSWIVICGFSLAMLLGFGKRRVEIAQEMTHQQRPALMSYSAAKLDLVLAVSTGICLLSYMLYTVAPETVQRHGTDRLVYTVPVVAYGLFRYLFKCQEGVQVDGPAELILQDWVFAATGVMWVLAVAAVLYSRSLGT
jgi:4-hydroxybenzoate polyprenyltransferase